MFLTTNSPRTHKLISEAERDYIIQNTTLDINKRSENLVNEVARENEALRNKSSSIKTPWLAIFKSKACIAIFVSHFSCNWSNYLFLTQLPTFMKEILKFDIKSVIT